MLSLCSLLISPAWQLKPPEKYLCTKWVRYQTMSNCDGLLRTSKMEEPIHEEWNLLSVLKGITKQQDQMFKGQKNLSPWVLQISQLGKMHSSKIPHDSRSKENFHRRSWPEEVNSMIVSWSWGFSWIRADQDTKTRDNDKTEHINRVVSKIIVHNICSWKGKVRERTISSRSCGMNTQP